MYSLCRSTHQKSNKIEIFILWFFYDLLWFFKDLEEIDKKEKDKTTIQNHSEGLFDRFWKFRR